MALLLKRVLDRIADRHRNDEGALRIELEGLVVVVLALVAAVSRDTARSHDTRRHVEHHLRTLAKPDLRIQAARRGIVGVQMQGVAHGQVGALDLSGAHGIALAAVAVVRHIVRVFSEGAHLMRLGGTAREDDVAAQVAARKVERHPADRIADRRRVHVARLQHIDIIAAVGLVVLDQLGTVLVHPRLESLVLEPIERLGLLLRTGGKQQHGHRRQIPYTGIQFHILSKSQFILIHNAVAASLDALHGKEPRHGTLAGYRAEVRIPVGHVVGHVGLHLVALATSQ